MVEREQGAINQKDRHRSSISVLFLIELKRPLPIYKCINAFRLTEIEA
jgi:hypothetical protein